MKPESFYINSARGAVADNGAVLDALKSGHLRGAVLDVWEGEPVVRMDLLERVDIATPHIAGYSFDGKVNGTRQIYEAACRHLGLQPAWDPTPLLPVPDHPELDLAGTDSDLKRAVETVYDLLADDRRMRKMANEPADRRGAYFDQLRKNYPQRREFQNTVVRLVEPNPVLAKRLHGIGFRVQ